ncbi:MAG TPA: phosphomannomutase/phosphoglucomutase [Gammaproteobacteria bacterium]|jgi:phosphomannomutase/phosphoglucomutase|nr:phosphomannomutase/phosphoglucomutase [Gammaproteobacteria bacterium]
MTTAAVALNPAIFRAYDIRGIVHETLTEEAVYLIGRALGSYEREQGGTQIVIGRDGRLSGPGFSQLLSEGIRASGCDVMDIGMVPTPVLYYATQQFAGHSGVMLTGSHNPANYNGLKIVMNGITFAETEIQQIYQRIIAQHFQSGVGDYQSRSVTQSYIDAIVSQIQLARPLRVVLDAGNGIAGDVAPALFRALGCEVIELYCDVDGTFPNHHPDPSQPENLQDLIQTVREQQADIGLAFDGDGDRLGVVTNSGHIIWPDRLLMLFAQALLAVQPQAKIIYDVKCTHHLDPFIRAQHGTPLMWKTGHSFIKAKLIETQAQLAGEMSGHFFFKDRWYGFDDALYAGARLLEILAAQSLSSETVFAALPNSINTAELKVAVTEEEKFSLMQQLADQTASMNALNVTTIDGLRVHFADGWGLIRASNTTPYLIMRFEAISESVLAGIQTQFRRWLLSVKPDWVLPF